MRRRLRVIVADPAPVERILIASILQSEGHHVTALREPGCIDEMLTPVAFDLLVIDEAVAETMEVDFSDIPTILLCAAPNTSRRRDRIAPLRVLATPVSAKSLCEAANALFAPATVASEGALLPIFEAKRLYDLDTSLGTDNVTRLLTMLEQELGSRPYRIESLMGAGDQREFVKEVHALKGAALTLGATRLCCALAELNCSEPSSLIRFWSAVRKTKEALAQRGACFAAMAPALL